MAFQSRFILAAVVFYVGGAGIAAAEDISVTARLSSDSIALGETAELRLSIRGTHSVDKIQLPNVPDLQIQHIGQESNFQFINGAISTEVDNTYVVTALSAGAHTIPPIEVTAKGKLYKTPALSLNVLNSGAAPPQPQLPAPSSMAPAPLPSETENKLAFLRVHVPKKDCYVGEKIPLEIQAFFRRDQQVSLPSVPQFASDAFAIADIREKPIQTSETLNGQPYAVLTWKTSMEALKAGTYPLACQLECLMILQRQPVSRRPRSFFDNFFNAFEQQHVTLTAPPESFQVQSLPEANKPETFTGAIGHFTISAAAQPPRLAVGDPITLTITLDGTGNFDRVTLPKLPLDHRWKTYPANAKFEPADTLGIAGKKIFEQALIPQQEGAIQIPAIPFSYFDPVAQQYQTVATAPMMIQVDPAPAAPRQPSPVPARASPTPSVAQTELVPNKINLGNVVPTLRPLMMQKGFLSIQLLLLLAAIVLSLLAHRRQRLARDPAYRRLLTANRLIRQQLQILETAETHQDAAAFFLAARRILQERLAEIWKLNAETITIADVRQNMPYAQTILQIFEITDAIAYADGAKRAYDLRSWKTALFNELQTLETRR